MNRSVQIAGRTFAVEDMRPFGAALVPSSSDLLDMQDVSRAQPEIQQLVNLAHRRALLVIHGVTLSQPNDWHVIQPGSEKNTTHIPHLDGGGCYPALLWAGASEDRSPTAFVRGEPFYRGMQSAADVLDVYTDDEREWCFAKQLAEFKSDLLAGDLSSLVELHGLGVRVRNDQILLQKLMTNPPSTLERVTDSVSAAVRKLFGCKPAKQPGYGSQFELNQRCIDAILTLKDRALQESADALYLHDWSQSSLRNTAVMCCNLSPLQDGGSLEATTLHFATVPEKRPKQGYLYRHHVIA